VTASAATVPAARTPTSGTEYQTPRTRALVDELRERFAETGPRIGTRTTPLAKAQTHRVITQVEQIMPGVPVEVVEIQTTADLRRPPTSA
jgi:hypothetical protein